MIDDFLAASRSTFSASKSLQFEPTIHALGQSVNRVLESKTQRRTIGPLVFLLVTSVFMSFALSVSADDASDDYNVAVGLYKRSRWKQASEEFRKFVKTYEKHEKAPMARLYLGLALVELDDYKAAREELRKFAQENRQNPNISQARYRIGECSYLLEDLENARIELEAFVQDFPNDPMCEHALPYLGDTILRLKEPTAALKIFDRAIEQFPRGKLVDDAKFGRAQTLEQLKRQDDAVRQYQELAGQKDGIRAADAQFHLGASYFERKQFPEAITAYLTLSQKFPQSPLVPAAQLNAGYALFQSGKFEEAARQFELAARAKSQEITARYWHGRSLKSFGDYAKALEVLKMATPVPENHPLIDAIIFEQALCERYLQHIAESRKLFEQVLLRSPNGELADDSLHAMIEMSLESGDLPDSEQLIARFRKEYPSSGLRLHIEMLNGRLDLARASGKQRDPQTLAAANELYDSAARRFEQVMDESSLPKTKSQARYYLALARQLQGNQPLALEIIAPLVEQAITDGAKTDFADAIVLQADSFYQLQKFDSALGSTAKYLELAPKGRQIVRALSIQALAAGSQKETAVVNAALARLTSEFGSHPLALLTLQQLAEAAESSEDWVTAGRLYESLAVLQKDPEKKAYAVRGIALSQYRQEQYLAAAESFGRIVSEFPAHSLVPECTYYQADSLKRADQNEKAIALFKKIFESVPSDKLSAPGAELEPPLEYSYKSGLQVARIYNKSSDVVEADAAYDALLKRFPKPLDLDKRLDEWAILNYVNKRYDQADAIWRRLVSEVPQSPLVSSARLSLAESDLIASKLDEAKAVFEELADSEKSPDDVKEQSLYQLTVLAVDRQRWADVRAIGNRLTSKFPNSKHRYYVAYSQVESCLAEPKPTDKELATAREQLKALQAEAANDNVNSTPWFDRVWVLLAELSFREKKYDEVLATVEDLKQRNRKSPFVYQAEEVLGRSYKQQAPPKFDEARVAFERVLADPFASRTETAAKSQFMIGETYFYQEKWDLASLAYQRVYSIYKFPEWQAAALLMAGKCDEKQNEWKSAVESYKLLITEFPQSSLIGEAKTRLETAQKKLGG